MTGQPDSLIENGLLRLDRLQPYQEKPPLFAPGEPKFWDDPHIAQEMLKFHLDPETDAASRPPAIIDQTAAWIVERLDLQPGDPLLDLGCGPGLYCQRWAAQGLAVTGMDLSPTSIDYARQHDPLSTYLCQNYVTLDVREAFKAITLIYGDFSVLADADRDRVLDNVRRALQPGSHFIFDVSAPPHHARHGVGEGWSVSDGPGFWKPGPHVALTRTFYYPEHDTRLDQYVVVEASGTISVYRIWNRAYTVETITALMEARGFEVAGLYGDLAGTPYTPESAWIGVVAQKG